MRLTLPAFFNREPALLEDNDLADTEYRPMTELDHFISKTKQMCDGLDRNIGNLDREISEKISQLNDLKRIRAAQGIALRFMEEDPKA